MTGRKSILGAFAAVAALGLGASAAGAQEVTLKGASCFPIGTTVSAGFENFVKRLNKEAKGLVQIHLVGGAPAIGSPFTMTHRMARGINDYVGCPDAYYGNVLPEAPAMRLSEYTLPEVRKNGALEYYDKLLNEKNIKFVSMVMDNGPFFLWLNKKIDKPDLTGLHLRVAPVYVPFFKALGATVQRSDMAQIYTYMENGTVAGFGWPLLGWLDSWAKVSKYWVDDGFYAAAVFGLMNLEKWNGLTKAQRDVFMTVSLAHEAETKALIDTMPARREWLKQQGLEPISFKGDDLKKWNKTAADAAWAEVYENSPEHGPTLRKLFTRQ